MPDKDKYHMISLICGIQKMKQMTLFTKQKQTHRQNKFMVTKWEIGGGVNYEFEISKYTLLYIKWTTGSNPGLLHYRWILYHLSRQ